MPVFGLGFSFEPSAFFYFDVNLGVTSYLISDNFLEFVGTLPNLWSAICYLIPVLAALFLKVLRLSS